MNPMQQLVQAAKTLHWRHGKGDISSVRVFADGRVEVEFKPYRCQPGVTKGRVINGRTVRLYGHQLTVPGERK